MKKTFSAILLLVSVISFSSFKMAAPKPKLFAGIESYYAGLSSVKANEQNKLASNDLANYILQATTSDKKIDMVLACPDNSFKSVAAQIVLQSLLSVNKITKLNVVSCGYQVGNINPQLIKALIKHGFQVTEQSPNANGRKTYEIKFGDNISPLMVYSKDVKDASIPQSKFFLLKLCGSTQSNCTDLPGAFYKAGLPFSDASEGISEDDADKLFTEVATEIIKAFNKAQNP